MTVLNNLPDEVDNYALPIDDLSNDVNTTSIGFSENLAIDKEEV